MASENQGQMPNEAVIYTPGIEGPYMYIARAASCRFGIIF